MGALESSYASWPGRLQSALLFSRVARFLSRHPLTAISSSALGIILAVALLPSLFATHLPLEMNVEEAFAPPSRAHFFGTDELGRDIYSRVIYGVRLSLGAGLGVVLLSLLIGTPVGIFTGFRGGRADTLLMRIADLFIAFPGLIMAMAIVAVLGRNLTNAMMALAITWWPQYARLARGQTLAITPLPFIEASRALGAGENHILRRHVLPNIASPIVIKGTLDVGLAILLTSALSFLGLGAQPPSPELGAMVTAGRIHLLTAWWYATMPGLMIFAIVLSLNLLGDGLRDLLDPTLRGRI